MSEIQTLFTVYTIHVYGIINTVSFHLYKKGHSLFTSAHSLPRGITIIFFETQYSDQYFLIVLSENHQHFPDNNNLTALQTIHPV